MAAPGRLPDLQTCKEAALDKTVKLDYYVIRCISNYTRIFHIEEIQMLNPFLQTQSAEKRRYIVGGNEEYAAQQQGQPIYSPAPRPSVFLWVGRLLIRIGEKLAKKDVDLKTTRESA
jgi:hypothetical protein